MISAIIPAKHESATMARIANETKLYVDEIIVVLHPDDYETISQVPKFATMVFEVRPGKGLALLAGAKVAKGDILVFIDADLSHNPADIPKLVKPIISGDADHVVASRMLGGSSELFYTIAQFVRLCGSHVITLLINWKYHSKLTDSQNGFRCIRKSHLIKMDLVERHTTIEQEMTVKSLRHNGCLIEIPAHEYERTNGESKIKVFRDGWRYLFLLIKFMVEPKPANWRKNEAFAVQQKYNVSWHMKRDLD